MAKDAISLSVVRLRPGYLELGPNRVLNALFLFISLALFAGGAATLAYGHPLIGIGVGALAGIFESNRRYSNRTGLTVEGDTVRVRAPRIGARVPQFTEYPRTRLAVALERWIDPNGDARTTVRIGFDQAELPDVLVEDPFFLRVREDREAAAAETLARKLRAAFAVKSENPPT